MKEKIAMGVFVFSIVMIVLLGFMILKGGKGDVTGRAIMEEEDKIVAEQQKSCTDSDAKNYGVKGVVDYCEGTDCSTKEDLCSGKNVFEWYCENNEAKSEEHICEYDCDGGACLSIAKDYKVVGGGGGGSGGSGGSAIVSSPAPTPTGETYDIGELTGETSQEIIKNDDIKFKISGNEYVLNLQDNTETQATINVAGQTFTLTVGDEKNIDLNNDNTADLYIKLRSINIINQKVKLILNLV